MPVFANKHLSFKINDDAALCSFVDRSSGREYAERISKRVFASIIRSGRVIPASGVEAAGENLTFKFLHENVTVSLNMLIMERYFVLEVTEVKGVGIDELVFADAGLSLSCSPDESFAACLLGLNLQVRVEELPGQNNRLRGTCSNEFGFEGAKAAVIGCPSADLGEVLREVLVENPDMPHSKLGGPWARSAGINRGSYIFDNGSITEETVDEWIPLVRALGFSHIKFNHSIRYGDWEPNRKIHPRGVDSVKAIIDRLHAAGISAGLHTYSCLVAQESKWVSPVPHPDLGKDAVFTLSEDITEESGHVPVIEPTTGMSTVMGKWNIKNSITLQVDDELIIYSDIEKVPPYAFTGCRRGAWGTERAEHAAGARVYHMKEQYGAFTPEYGTPLFTEVAAGIADICNYCGFDMIYFDALEAVNGLLGHGWHHEAEFVAEVQKHLKKPAVMEMSAFHHHLWRYRSRYVAWDSGVRAYKSLIDKHLRVNLRNRRMLLPGTLGWWALYYWYEPNIEPTRADDIEYLCVKALATGSSHSLQDSSHMFITPENYAEKPCFRRLADIFRRYEQLRLSGCVPDEVKKILEEPGEEFYLEGEENSRPVFRRIDYAKHKVERIDDGSNVWEVSNRFDRQKLRFRIEPLVSCDSYDNPENLVIRTFGNGEEGSRIDAARGVTAGFEASREKAPSGDEAFSYYAQNDGASPSRAFCRLMRTFSPILNLMNQTEDIKDQIQAYLETVNQKVGLGVWIHGDGNGETLNIRLRSPKSVVGGFADHYVIIDFSGWRYFELIEPEAERVLEYRWPDESCVEEWKTGREKEENITNYNIHRHSTDFSRIESVGIWYQQIPEGKKINCLISPLKAVPLIEGKISRPVIRAGDDELAFPVTMKSGQHLEFAGEGDAFVYDREGNIISKTAPDGRVPLLEHGTNKVEFSCLPAGSYSSRAMITINAIGEAIR